MAKRTITIRITTNKNGKTMAHYWGLARRWLPMSVDAAELALATGTYYGCDAVRHVPYVPAEDAA